MHLLYAFLINSVGNINNDMIIVLIGSSTEIIYTNKNKSILTYQY
jgi:hypothetical protein